MQRRVCLQFATAKNWTLLECIEDDGVSGSRDREGLRVLRKIVRERRAGVVVTRDGARIARNWSIYADFAQLCEDHGVRIAFADACPAPGSVAPLRQGEVAPAVTV